MAEETCTYTLDKPSSPDQLERLHAIVGFVSAEAVDGTTSITLLRKPGVQRELARTEAMALLGAAIVF